MPTYEYACRSCGEHLDAVQSFTDDPLAECPACKGVLRKVYGNIGIAFKGSGFYKTDSRSAANGKRSESARDGSGGDGPPAKDSSGDSTSSKEPKTSSSTSESPSPGSKDGGSAKGGAKDKGGSKGGPGPAAGSGSSSPKSSSKAS